MHMKFEILSDSWENTKKIAVFGFGKLGRGNIDALMKKFRVVAIIDHNPQLHGMKYKGIEIKSFDNYLSAKGNEKFERIYC